MVAFVQPVQQRHVVLVQLKVVQPLVLHDALLLDGLWNDGDAALQPPPQKDLRRAPLMLLGDPGDGGIGRQVARAQRSVGHHRHAHLATRLPQRPLRQPRMQLHLVDHGRHGAVGEQLPQVRGGVVAHADGAGPPPSVQLLQRLPRLRAHQPVLLAVRGGPRHPRPVDEDTVHAVGVQPLEGG
eukprot:CAMPEP_0118950796 /NCGR_PEP_ID=MMETSP1169-20130426/52023_1 /TAXON_ID=36882 /ORGANISM="Pyramimonas obovata, Strain CCMP722" /LENGTH=182 /DNA_ID=CAMNT_0006897713 /DNA_START=197 /DNA_END=741 /DNA_ORIENTATION=-